MAKLLFARGVTSVVVRIKILDSTSTVGSGKTGLTFSSSGLIISTILDTEVAPTVYTAAGSTIETITTLGTYAAPTATKCRFKEVDATNHPGLYELQFANARFDGSTERSLIITVLGATGAAAIDAEYQLSRFDVNDLVRGALTALPNAAAEAAGGLYTRGAGAGQINQAADGMVDTNTVRLANVAQSLTDLKDFADDGYDPSTNKVQGVVLVDTVTTLTNAPPDEAGVTTLLARLTAARAGYLDVLNGIVAAIWAAVADAPGVTTLLARLTATRAGLLDNLDATISSRATQASVDTVDDFVDTEVAAILAAVDTEVAAIKTKTDSLTFTVAGLLDVNLKRIADLAAGATNLDRSARGIVRGAADAGASTTSIPTSSLDPAAVTTNQFKGRIVIFDRDTTTTDLRGQATDITGSSSGGTLTVTALTTAPVSGDTFVIV